MKFKGFWTGFWELQKHSCEWLKDYWFAYTLLLVACTAVCFIPYAVEEYRANKRFKKTIKDDLEDFLSE